MTRQRARAAQTRAAKQPAGLKPAGSVLTKLEPAGPEPIGPELIGREPIEPEPIGSTDEPANPAEPPPLVWAWDARPLNPGSWGRVQSLAGGPGTFTFLRAWVDQTDHSRAQTAAQLAAALGWGGVPPVVIEHPRRLYRPAGTALPPLFADGGTRAVFFPTADDCGRSAALLPGPRNASGERPDWDRLREELVAAGYKPVELAELRPRELLNALERVRQAEPQRQPPQPPNGSAEAYPTRPLTPEGFAVDPSPAGSVANQRNTPTAQLKPTRGRPAKYSSELKHGIRELTKQFPNALPRELAARYNAKHGTELSSSDVKKALKAAKQSARRAADRGPSNRQA